jgi:hypothetical protein
VTTRYPRGAEAEREHHAEAMAALARTRTPEDAAAVVLRLLVAQRLVDTEGLPNADRQGIYEPALLASSELIGKLARRVAPASVKKHLTERQAASADDPHRTRRHSMRLPEQHLSALTTTLDIRRDTDASFDP